MPNATEERTLAWGSIPLLIGLLVGPLGSGCAAEEMQEGLEADGGVAQLSPFAGTWVVTELEGERAPRQDIWTFTDDDIDIDSAFGEFHGTFTFDQSKSPKEIDIFLGTVTPGLAIYQLEADDTLLLMIAEGAGERATHFEIGAEDYDHIRFVRYTPPE